MIKIGLCGWTISQREYVERFPVVEVQQTFYHPPPPRTLLRWRESTPANFEFTLKAWQLITHEASSSTYRRFKGTLTAAEKAECGSFRWSEIVRSAWKTTAECATILRASAVLFQCPASFKPSEENVERMRKFFRSTERGALRFLWEPRGTSWDAQLIHTLCVELDLVHVVDPFVNQTTTPEFIYYRLHGLSGARHVYSDAELGQLVKWTPRDRQAYVMFNNIPRDHDSERFRRMLAPAR